MEVKIIIDPVLEKRYAALCVGCGGNENNETRPLRSLCCTAYSQVGRCID